MRIQTAERQVQPNVVPRGVDPGQGAFGGGVSGAGAEVGNTLQKLGALMQQRAIERQQELDERDVVNAELGYRSEMDNMLLNKDTGLLNKKLEQAQGIGNLFMEQEAEIRKKYAGGMVSEFQRTKFDQLANEYRQQSLNNVARYEVDQGNQSIILTNTTRMASDLATLTPENMAVIAQHDNDSLEAIGKVRGWSAETKELNKKSRGGERVQKLISDALGRGDYQSAQQLLNDNQESIAAMGTDALGKVKQAVRETTLIETSNRLKLIGNSGSSAVTNKDITASMQEIDGIGKILKSEGLTDDAVAIVMKQAKTTYYQNAFNYKLEVDKDPEGAKKIIDSSGDVLDKVVAAEMTSQYNKAVFSTKLDNLYDKDLTAFRQVDGTPDLEKMLKALNGRYTGADLVDAQNYIRAKASLDASIINSKNEAEIKAAYNDIDSIILNKGSKQSAINALNKHKLLDSHARKTLSDYIEVEYRQAGGTGTKTDPAAWFELYDKMEKGQIKNKWQMLRDFGDKISFGDMKSFWKAFDSKGGNESEFNKFSLSSTGTAILKSAEIDPNDYGRFWDFVSVKIDDFEKKMGRKPTGEEQTTILRDSVSNVVVNEKWRFGPAYWENQTRRFNLPPNAVWNDQLKSWVVKGADGKLYKVEQN